VQTPGEIAQVIAQPEGKAHTKEKKYHQGKMMTISIPAKAAAAPEIFSVAVRNSIPSASRGAEYLYRAGVQKRIPDLVLRHSVTITR